MYRPVRSVAVVALAAVVLGAPMIDGGLVLSAGADPAAQRELNAYRVEATPANLERLALAGFDMTEGRRGGEVEIVGTEHQVGKLRAQGVNPTVVKDAKGQTSAERQRGLMARRGSGDAGYQVWRRYDRVPGDGKEQYLEFYSRLLEDRRGIVRKVKLGETHQGREIIALKVTKDALRTPDNTRPAVLYNALQHAREWLAGETCRRTLEYVTSSYGRDPTVTRLVDTRELWFVCVANPDGYEHTFTPGNRLWRKNMADNDGDGVRGEPGVDGVDPNRNFVTNWGLDDEGSSSDPGSETYRGPSAGSEPETQAMMRLWDRVDFAFQKNDHTAAELLLWPHGFQQNTPTPDNSIFEALAGTDARPAIADDEERFDPDLSSELYITNGDTLDDAYHSHGILGYTPEGTIARDPTVTGFEFEDDEAEVQKEFRRHRRFALDLAESADVPDRPESHLGNTVADFQMDAFSVSYGDPQPVQVTARRSLGAVSAHYRINGGVVRVASTQEQGPGERYGDSGVYFHRMRGEVTGTEPGDSIEVWFEAGGQRSPSFTYRAERESAAPVLVLADENYTAGVPAQDTNGPHYVQYYTAALADLGVAHEVYDVDAHDMTSPHPLGVLSHFDAVVWETGDDYLTRRPGQGPGTGVARASVETVIAVRDYLNEGGKLFFSGKNAGRQLAEVWEYRNFGFPEPDEAPDGRWCWFMENELVDGCVAHNNDFLQYHLGAYIYVGGGNSTDENGEPFPIVGVGEPFGPSSFTFGPDGAGNQEHTATFAVTSSILDPQRFPRYADSRKLAAWDRPGAGPFAPYSGQNYMSAGADSSAFKRLHRTVDLTNAGTGELSFQVSADTEPLWDFLVVEAREVGTENWTTLPERDGLTSPETGDSCASGWRELHPQLDHYQTLNADGTCSPTGTTGEWHALTGSSSGWQEWNADLTPFAGKNVELSISMITDWGVLGLGTWIDDAELTVDGTRLAFTDFESHDHGWQAGPAPDGTQNPVVGWTRATEEFKEGAVIGTTDTVYTGFGFEGLAGADRRAEFMSGVLTHLGVGH